MTYTDAYLEFRNNFLTKEKFTEHFRLKKEEVDQLFYAAKICRAMGDTWRSLDFYYNRQYNEAELTGIRY